MRLKSADKIAGVPVAQVRTLLQRWADWYHTTRGVAAMLKLSPSAASRLVKALKDAGYIEAEQKRRRATQFYTRTLGGARFAAATMAKPLHTETVERMLRELVVRARAINADESFAYRIARIELFGSALDGAARPNDIDLAVTLRNRYDDDEAQRAAYDSRIETAFYSGRRFRTMLERASWPRDEVLRALRNRARSLSLFDGAAPRRLDATARAVFDEHDRE